MVEQYNVYATGFGFFQQNVARMRIAVHKTIAENHVRIELSDFAGHLKFVDFVRFDVVHVVDLAALQELHDQHTMTGQVPVNFRHSQPFVVAKHNRYLDKTE